MAGVKRDSALFTVSVAAELAGIHPQTVRQYDRLGLVVATRTRGGGRRYSLADVERLQEIQRLSQEEGVSLAGIARIFELQDEVTRLRSQVKRLRSQIEQFQQEREEERLRENRVFAAGVDGDMFMADGHMQLREFLRRNRASSEVYSAPMQEESDCSSSSHEMVVWAPLWWNRSY
ncbi:MAG: helix-turn-helix transcriptional regulator [Actinomycetaceae bacterium]|nr:helix-turn-helix transcriptional regulator [Actinomycetaceae bacterium]